MKYMKWIGLAAAVLLIVSCFTPWVIIASQNIVVSGVDATGTNYGLNGIAGIEMSRSILSVHYGHGLAKLQSGSNSSADDKNKHRVFSITLGLKL